MKPVRQDVNNDGARSPLRTLPTAGTQRGTRSNRRLIHSVSHTNTSCTCNLLLLGQPDALHEHILYRTVDKTPSAEDHGLLTCNKQKTNQSIRIHLFANYSSQQMNQIELLAFILCATFMTIYFSWQLTVHDICSLVDTSYQKSQQSLFKIAAKIQRHTRVMLYYFSGSVTLNMTAGDHTRTHKSYSRVTHSGFFKRSCTEKMKLLISHSFL